MGLGWILKIYELLYLHSTVIFLEQGLLTRCYTHAISDLHE